MGLKQGAIGNTLEEHNGNLVGTHCELEGNMLGTKEKLKKPSPHTSTQNLNFLECMLQPTHWLHVFWISKTVGHHFWPGLTAGAELNKEEKQKVTPPSPCPPPPKKEKTRANHECMLSHPIGCMKFLFPKLFVSIFGLG
jgi:hypothetical protein